MSHLTTHVLDTSQGKPAQGITVILHQEIIDGNWEEMAKGETNEDGRIMDLLPEDKKLKPGNYRLTFLTGDYFSKSDIKGFYPSVPVVFTITDEEHYHVPLLLNPYGYSTYRGS
ncbi:MAG: hydroxyisourate hydrolase [Bacteroidetes bacterium]|nr:hydroxyisourate hydrolase [Bacteroidia bacterium]PCH68984.1 MAG: hydroxyisourate hydrolase [Bacteroidota bacterium]